MCTLCGVAKGADCIPMKPYRSIVAITIMSVCLAVPASAQTDLPSSSQATRKENVAAAKESATQRQKELRAKQWEKALQQFVENEQVVAFCIVDPSLDPPAIRYGTQPRGKTAMRALGRAISCDWQEINGVQAFGRSENLPTDEVMEASNWVLSLDQAALKRLMQGSMTTRELPPSTRDRLLKLAAWDSDMSFVVADHNDNISVKLAMSTSIEYADPGTGQI